MQATRWNSNLLLLLPGGTTQRLTALVLGGVLIAALYVVAGNGYLQTGRLAAGTDVTAGAVQPDRPATTKQTPNDGYLLPEYDATPSWGDQPTGEESGLALAVSLVVKLGIVLAAIYGTAWAIKRFRLFTQPVLTNGQEIRVMETAHLAPQRALHLIEVQGQTLLIGTTEQNMSLITVLGDTAATRQPRVSAPASTPPPLVPAAPVDERKPGPAEERPFSQVLADMESRVAAIRQQIERLQQASRNPVLERRHPSA